MHSWVTEIFLASEDASLFISIIKDFGVPPDWAWTSFEIASKGRVMQWTEKITKASNYLSTWWRFFEWVIEHIHQCSSGLCKQRVEWGLFPFYAKCRKQNPVKTWDLILYLRWLVDHILRKFLSWLLNKITINEWIHKVGMALHNHWGVL